MDYAKPVLEGTLAFGIAAYAGNNAFTYLAEQFLSHTWDTKYQKVVFVAASAIPPALLLALAQRNGYMVPALLFSIGWTSTISTQMVVNGFIN